MASNPTKSAAVMSAVLLAAAAGTAALVHDEGWVTKSYGDPTRGSKLATACAGVTEGVLPNRTYTDQECQVMTAQAEIKIGLAIAQCLPEKLPRDVRSSFQRVAYNAGPAAFCKSPMQSYAKAGNLGRACAAIHDYYIVASVPTGAAWPCPAPQRVTKGGKRYCKLPGLQARRASEQAQCEAGLKPGAL